MALTLQDVIDWEMSLPRLIPGIGTLSGVRRIRETPEQRLYRLAIRDLMRAWCPRCDLKVPRPDAHADPLACIAALRARSDGCPDCNGVEDDEAYASVPLPKSFTSVTWRRYRHEWEE